MLGQEGEFRELVSRSPRAAELTGYLEETGQAIILLLEAPDANEGTIEQLQALELSRHIAANSLLCGKDIDPSEYGAGRVMTNREYASWIFSVPRQHTVVVKDDAALPYYVLVDGKAVRDENYTVHRDARWNTSVR